jgi:hypothetical protein
MTDKPDFIVGTQYGQLDIHVHSGDYARVEVGIPMNVDERSFTINGVAHAVQARMHLWSDGRWHLGQEDDRSSQIYEPRLSRRDEYSGPGPMKVASRSANEKAREAIEEAVNARLSEPDGQAVIALAGIAKLEKELDMAVAKHERAKDEVEATADEVDAANDRLTRARFVYERQSGGRTA